MNNYDEVIKNFNLWYHDLKDLHKFEQKRKEFLEYHSKNGVTRVQIEPTNRCNYNCIMCPIDELEKEKVKYDMSFDDFKIIVDKLPSSVTNICLSGLGEPFLNKDYIQMAKYAKEKGFYVEVYNNGSLFDSSIIPYIDEVNFSVDSPDDKLLLEIRKGVSIDKLFDNIKKAVKEKEKHYFHVNINFTANYKNYQNIRKLYDLANILKIDKLHIQATSNNYAIDSVKYQHFKEFVDKNNLIDWEHIVNSYCKDDSFSLTIWYPRKMQGFCSWGFSNIYVTKNCDIIQCCQKVTKPLVFGNLKQSNFNDIYNSKEMCRFREKHIRQVNIPLCEECPN
ncbi:radical SAM/SPASM domain-containing protein [Arcobacter sp. FWKO B]|uniref:radical SAM protein n=1 Tax=Arcobacter sp. FWKO B TaxID=2593672 RepID=UPI0018A57C9A|nr:radical SAM/SPASM domain-containing protein [Arcobacter sp. FWKO B]QOG12161.1 radical SAM protein [Arcobacter sp. FWKO B]